MKKTNYQLFNQLFQQELYALQHDGQGAYGKIIEEGTHFFEAVYHRQSDKANRHLHHIVQITAAEPDPAARIEDLQRYFTFLAGSFADRFSQKLSFSWEFLATATTMMKIIETWRSEEEYIEGMVFITDTFIKTLDSRDFEIVNHPHIIRFVHHVEHHIYERLNVQQAAKSLSLSAGYLSRLVKEHLGVSGTQYIKRKKLEESLNLLRNNHESINAIASKLGFPNGSYFIKVFKERYDITPKQYRQSLINEIKINTNSI